MGIIAEQKVTFTTHNDKPALLLCAQDSRLMHSINQPLQPLVVPRRISVPSRSNNTDLPILRQKTDKPRNHRVIFRKTRPVVVERNITIKRDKVRTIEPEEAQELGGVENQPDVVERGRDESAPADEAVIILVPECIFEWELGEEGPDRGDEEV